MKPLRHKPKPWVETQLDALDARIKKLESIAKGGLTKEELNRVMAALDDLNQAATMLRSERS
jgi:hypothetical protein